MKNKRLNITLFIFILTAISCKKDLSEKAITITAFTNDTIKSFSFQPASPHHYSNCPPPGSFFIGTFRSIPSIGEGNYQIELDGEDLNTACVSIFGRIAENQDSIGKTVVNIKAFFTKEGNVVGFKNIELKRPHSEYEIVYQFIPDTYIE